MQVLTSSFFIMKLECKITDQQQQKKPSLSPDRLCYSSVLSPRAGMRKHSTQVKSSAKVKQFCMLALSQNKVPQTATEWALACEAVLLHISRITSNINGIVRICRCWLDVGIISVNQIPINYQWNVMFAFVCLKLVPFPITQAICASWYICSCYSASSIVDVE